MGQEAISRHLEHVASWHVYRDLRLTLTALPHERGVRETQDDLMRVLAWSFSCLALGLFPSHRHDGAEFHAEDRWRSTRAGQDLVHGAVVEIKGDWKQMRFCFDVPYWTGKADRPICWRCRATKASLATDHGLEPGSGMRTG